MNVCNKYKIYVDADSAKQLFSEFESIMYVASEVGPPGVIVDNNVCNHIYLRPRVVKRLAKEAGLDIYKRDFENFDEFETYLATSGIYVAHFRWQEVYLVDMITRTRRIITELGGYHLVLERLPSVRNYVRVLRGRLYGGVTHNKRKGDGGALFIRRADTDEILSDTHVIETIIDNNDSKRPKTLATLLNDAI